MKKRICLLFILLFCGFSGVSFANGLGGYWKLILVSQDIWKNPSSNFACGTPIVGMGWWEQPTFCTATTFSGNKKIEATQGYVCVPPVCEQVEFAEVAGAGTCTIEGKPQVFLDVPSYVTWVVEPCQHLNGMIGSDYGEVTIRKIIKVYEWVCTSGDCPPPSGDTLPNPDPGDPKCNQVSVD